MAVMREQKSTGSISLLLLLLLRVVFLVIVGKMTSNNLGRLAESSVGSVATAQVNLLLPAIDSAGLLRCGSQLADSIMLLLLVGNFSLCLYLYDLMISLDFFILFGCIVVEFANQSLPA